MRYFVELRYDGADFCGWQRQPDVPSLQQTIEAALTKLLGSHTEITGAGRTDSGVNASYYVAHFDSPNPIDIAQVLYKLNMMLPKSIGIIAITPVADTLHARFSALEREYQYYISTRKNPFRRFSAWLYYVPLDVEAMNAAAAKLLEYSDFTSFAKLGSDNKTNICKIMDAHWSIEPDGVLKFTIRADRFLRNMVRSVVGTLVDVGRGKYSVSDFCAIVEARDLSRSSAGAPAQGLFLSDVVYDKEQFTKTL